MIIPIWLLTTLHYVSIGSAVFVLGLLAVHYINGAKTGDLD
jgi:hypothetical protein